MTAAELEWELRRRLLQAHSEVATRIGTAKELGLDGTVVATSGCFDILHAGHVRFPA
jgi:bifunctional ADP-heptose synthase (sugar kinase/adenylyltransferase)